MALTDTLGGLFRGASRLPRLLAYGPDDPRLSADQNQQLARQSIMNAGLSLLSGRGHDQPTIGQAFLGSQGQAQAQREELLKQAQQQRLSEAISAGPEGVKRAVQQAVASGDIGTANALVGYINATTQAPQKRYQVVGGALVDMQAPGGPALVEGIQPAAEPEPIRVGGRDFPNTPEGAKAALAWDAQLAASGRAPTGGGGSDELTPYQRANVTNQVSDDFYRHTKDHRTALRSITTGLGAIEDALAGNGPAQVAVANAFQRALVDPGVSVREGEFAVLRGAQSVMAKHRTEIEALLTGRANTVSPEVIRDMVPLLKRGQQDFIEDYNRQYKEAIRRAGRFGVELDIRPLGGGKGAEAAPSGGDMYEKFRQKYESR